MPANDIAHALGEWFSIFRDAAGREEDAIDDVGCCVLWWEEGWAFERGAG